MHYPNPKAFRHPTSNHHTWAQVSHQQNSALISRNRFTHIIPVHCLLGKAYNVSLLPC